MRARAMARLMLVGLVVLAQRSTDVAVATDGAAATKPHVIIFLVDDVGWHNVGWHDKVSLDPSSSYPAYRYVIHPPSHHTHYCSLLAYSYVQSFDMGDACAEHESMMASVTVMPCNIGNLHR